MFSLWNNLAQLSYRLMVEEECATGTEYAVVLGLVLVVVIIAAALFGIHFTGATSAVSAGLGNSADALGGSFGPSQLRSQTTVSHP